MQLTCYYRNIFGSVGMTSLRRDIKSDPFLRVFGVLLHLPLYGPATKIKEEGKRFWMPYIAKRSVKCCKTCAYRRVTSRDYASYSIRPQSTEYWASATVRSAVITGFMFRLGSSATFRPLYERFSEILRMELRSHST